MFIPIPLNLPLYPAKIQEDGDKLYIYDALRKKRLVLTPEEWVRQQWIQHLIRKKKYPRSLIKIEGGMRLNEMRRRTDLVVFNTYGDKVLLAEFKSPHVKISQATFEQIANYNSTHRIPLLLVSNGIQHYCSRIHFERGDFEFLADLPDYEG